VQTRCAVGNPEVEALVVSADRERSETASSVVELINYRFYFVAPHLCS